MGPAGSARRALLALALASVVHAFPVSVQRDGSTTLTSSFGADLYLGSKSGGACRASAGRSRPYSARDTSAIPCRPPPPAASLSPGTAWHGGRLGGPCKRCGARDPTLGESSTWPRGAVSAFCPTSTPRRRCCCSTLSASNAWLGGLERKRRAPFCQSPPAPSPPLDESWGPSRPHSRLTPNPQETSLPPAACSYNRALPSRTPWCWTRLGSPL